MYVCVQYIFLTIYQIYFCKGKIFVKECCPQGCIPWDLRVGWNFHCIKNSAWHDTVHSRRYNDLTHLIPLYNAFNSRIIRTLFCHFSRADVFALQAVGRNLQATDGQEKPWHVLRLNKEIPERGIRQMASHAALCCRTALLLTDATLYPSQTQLTMLSMQNLAKNKDDDENNFETIKCWYR